MIVGITNTGVNKVRSQSQASAVLRYMLGRINPLFRNNFPAKTGKKCEFNAPEVALWVEQFNAERSVMERVMPS